jgi:hypothetical protein
VRVAPEFRRLSMVPKPAFADTESDRRRDADLFIVLIELRSFDNLWHSDTVDRAQLRSIDIFYSYDIYRTDFTVSDCPLFE